MLGNNENFHYVVGVKLIASLFMAVPDVEETAVSVCAFICVTGGIKVS